MNNLAGVDLNLLVAFEALMEEQHVGRAARRVGLSQPAMSNALARLRSLVGDPLLVRSGRTMAPTARALALQAPVREALQTLSQALAALSPFDPRTARRRFRLYGPDYASFVLLPALLKVLSEEAPGIDLEWLVMEAEVTEAAFLEREIDLATGYLAGAGSRLHRVPMFEDSFCGVARRGHPALDKPLTPAEWAALPHVLVSPRGGRRGVVDVALGAVGLERRIAVLTPHFLVVPHLVAGSDYVCTLAARVARAFAAQLPLQLFEPPLPLPPFTVGLCWHNRSDGDPAHRWLRERLLRLVAEVIDPPLHRLAGGGTPGP